MRSNLKLKPTQAKIAPDNRGRAGLYSSVTDQSPIEIMLKRNRAIVPDKMMARPTAILPLPGATISGAQVSRRKSGADGEEIIDVHMVSIPPGAKKGRIDRVGRMSDRWGLAPAAFLFLIASFFMRCVIKHGVRVSRHRKSPAPKL
jgi:hypothetical protein